MKRWILVVFIVLVLAAVVLIAGFTQIRLDAIQEPGHLETYLATRAKQFLIDRSSRDGIPPAPADFQTNTEEGDKLYATECSMCHGSDGRTATVPVAGCIRGPRISLRPRCGAIPIANCSGL